MCACASENQLSQLMPTALCNLSRETFRSSSFEKKKTTTKNTIFRKADLMHIIQYLSAFFFFFFFLKHNLDRVKRIWFLSSMRAAKVQSSLRIRAVSPEPSLLAHTSSESRGTFGQKARSLAPLNGWACAVKICHDGMLEDTNSLDGAHFINSWRKMLH